MLRPVSLLLTARALHKRGAVHALLDGRIRFVCVNVNLIQCAVILAAKIVRALSDSAVDARILSFVHDKLSFHCGISCRAGLFCAETAGIFTDASEYNSNVSACNLCRIFKKIKLCRICQKKRAFRRFHPKILSKSGYFPSGTEFVFFCSLHIFTEYDTIDAGNVTENVTRKGGFSWDT